MKTTVEITDSLLDRARTVATREHVTLRTLIERGLRRVVAESEEKPVAPFRLRRASFKGEGLAPEFAEGSWDEIRDTAYQGRGG
jgi:hypothetical protein